MKKQNTLLITVLASFLSACGSSGGGGGGSTGPSAPTEIVYGASTAKYLLQVAITPSPPTVTGTVTSWSILPALPAGLVFDETTGTITGTPGETSELATYVVTATGPLGSVSTEIEIGIDFPPRFAYVANESDDTLSIYTVDAHTGKVVFHGYEEAAPGETRPEETVVHPDGRFLYVPNRGDDGVATNISTYSIDRSTGQLTALAPVPSYIGPQSMVIAPGGEHAYVTAFGSDLVVTYSVDVLTGAMTENRTTLTGNGPTDVSLDPLGRFAYVANSLSNDVSVYRIDPATGNLTESVLPTTVGGGTPIQVAIDPEGEHAYVLVEGAEVLVPFMIDQVSGALTPVAGEEPTGEVPSSVAIHPTGRFAYVTNTSEDSVSIYRLEEDAGRPLTVGTAATGDEPALVTFDASGLYAYVANSGSNDMSIYTVNLATGELTSQGEFRTRDMPVSMSLTQGEIPVRESARFLYTVNSESQDVTAFTVDPETGALTESGAPTVAGTHARDLLTHPNGRFLYVANASGGDVRTYTIDASTGILTEIGSNPLTGKPRSIAIDPAGRYLYAAVRGADIAVAFSVDPDTGLLTETATAPTGIDPNGIAVDPTGRFVMISAIESDDITTYRVAGGQFVSTATSVAAPGRPLRMRFSPRGDFLYVALNTAHILVPYAIDPHTGELTPVPPGTGTGNRPTVVDVHPSGRFAYAAISDKPDGVGHVTVYQANAETGQLTSGTNVTAGTNPRDVSVDPSGQFLFVVNETSDDLSVFVIDQETGGLSGEVQVPVGLEPWAVAFTKSLE